MENIADFEFRTPDALCLKQDMRRWYYGEQDSDKVDELLRKFNDFFSGNVFLDAVGDLLWSVVDESPLEPDDWLTKAMLRIPRREIIGRSIRAYGIIAGGNGYQFEKWESEAAVVVNSASGKIDQQLQRERDWRRANRISLFSAAVSLAGITSLVGGVFFLLSHVRILMEDWDIYSVVIGFPSSYRWNPGTSFIFLIFFVLATGTLLWFLRQMSMTLRAGLLWTLYDRKRYKLRRKRVAQFRSIIKESGFTGYREKIQNAAEQLAEVPPGAWQNLDPSRTLLGQAGMDKVFQGLSLKPICRGRAHKEFYSQVESCHVQSRVWIILLCAALVILRDLMFIGPITAFFLRLM